MVVLFLAFSLSGCLSEAPEPVHSSTTPRDQVEEPIPDFLEPVAEKGHAYPELNLTLNVENELKIVRFFTDHEDGVKTSIFRETGDIWTWGAFLHGGGHVYDASWMDNEKIRVNDHNTTVNEEIWDVTFYSMRQPNPARPGVHTVAFYAEGEVHLTVSLTSKSADYEILHNETASIRTINEHHPDWDRDTHVSILSVSIFKGSLEIAPEKAYMDVMGNVFDENGYMSIDLDDNLRCRGGKYNRHPGGHTDGPAVIHVDTSNFLVPLHAVHILIVDWSIDLQEKKCWGSHN